MITADPDVVFDFGGYVRFSDDKTMCENGEWGTGEVGMRDNETTATTLADKIRHEWGTGMGDLDHSSMGTPPTCDWLGRKGHT